MARPVVDLAAAGLADEAERLACLTSKETPSTACTAPTLRWKMMPRVSGKCMTRLLTDRSGSPAPLPLDAGCGWTPCDLLTPEATP